MVYYLIMVVLHGLLVLAFVTSTCLVLVVNGCGIWRWLRFPAFTGGFALVNSVGIVVSLYCIVVCFDVLVA